jgi:hypothetical protein
MHLNEVLACLARHGIGTVGTWVFRGRKGITLGDHTRNFPNATGPQYQIDLTDSPNPELTAEEIAAIERRFGKL